MREKIRALLLAMRERGEDPAEIARLAGTTVKGVRELIDLVGRGNGEVPTPAMVDNGQRQDVDHTESSTANGEVGPTANQPVTAS